MSAAPESAAEIAAAITSGAVKAVRVVERSLARIASTDKTLNCFTSVRGDAALREAATLDSAIAAGKPVGALAGVPFAVKNLFDIEGETTIAGSIIDAELPPAQRDAFAVAKLKAAGAILVGALNMDEYAYGFTTENAHYGATRNPHDPALMAGGSSGGSAAAVAAGMVAISLGSDTNGSIRVPAAFCGVFGLKPTFGAVSRAGVRPFVHSLDHVGPFARNTADLALTFETIRGHDAEDTASAARDNAPMDLSAPAAGLRVGRLTGWFDEMVDQRVRGAVNIIAEALHAEPVLLPSAKAARSAAFCITAAEGGALHLKNLRTRAKDFDPATRDRLIAGAMLPARIVMQGQRYRRLFLEEALRLFDRYDMLIAPATPFPPPRIGRDAVEIDGAALPVRANAGMFAQPFSFIGLPALVAPIVRAGEPPVGVQLIAAPWREDIVLRVAAHLEREGFVGAGGTPPMLERAA